MAVHQVGQGGVRLGMGGHHDPVKGDKDEWLTPPELIEAVGPFDLDPCAPIVRPWPTAARHLTLEDDGLASEWRPDEFVWCNPPYGQQTWTWLDRLAEHPGGGVALIFARTETAGFFRSVWRRHPAILFLEGRLFFHHVDGTRARANSGAPSALVGYGQRGAERLRAVHASGAVAGALVEHYEAGGANA